MSREWLEGDTWETFKARAAAEREAATQAAELAAAEQTTREIDWYRDTGHCGACGQPGVFCLCRTACGCLDLHECGSGLTADPAEVFSVAAPVSVDQGDLFGVGGEHS